MCKLTSGFRIIDYDTDDINFTMAADEVLMEDGWPTLTFYDLSPTITLGPKQSYHDINVAACQDDKIKVARRISVGTSTICGPDNIHFSIIFGADKMIGEFVPMRLDAAFSRVIARAFKRLEIDVDVIDFYDTREDPLPDCFMSKQPNQGIVDGKKLVSIAGNRNKKGIVLHVVIPKTMWVYNAGKYLSNGNMDPVNGTCLNDLGLTCGAVKGAIEKEFFFSFGLVRTLGLPLALKKEAIKLRQEKYLSKDWVYDGRYSQ